MRSPQLGLVVVSAYVLLATSVAGAAKEFKKFSNPTRAKARSLGKYEVDLKYEIHRGIESESEKFLNFSNIPYAEPPVGDFRFEIPVEPLTTREGVNDGSVTRICPQTQVGWVPFAQDFLGDFSKPFVPQKWDYPITPENNYSTLPDPLPQLPFPVDEDCLTLDVMVPKTVWEYKETTLAAVVVWIYGGGFIFGWKSQYGSPEGLFTAADENQQLSDENIIYVAMNYRLGAFGWLGGKKYEEDGGIPNLGLLDQAFALKWVKEHIQKFGGDPRRITVMGQSAGASSILHHITAGGGKEKDRPEFDSAILQSPGFFPQPNNTKNDLAYDRFLHLAGATDLVDLRTKDTAVLQQANAIMTYESEYGYFNFGPTIDGDYVPDLPGRLLAAGNFHTEISLLAGHQALDGLLFTPPWIRNDAGLAEHSKDLYPGIPPEVLSYIGSKYHIPKLVIEQYKIGVVADFLDDIAIQCNNYYLTEAFLNSEPRYPIYRYSFNSLPAIHGYDAGYTYFPNPPLIKEVNEPMAKYFQATIVNFLRYRDPSPEDSNITTWEIYEKDKRRVMNFGTPNQHLKLPPRTDYIFKSGDDKMDLGKCAYWQSAPYYPDFGKAGFVVQGVERKERLELK